AELMKELLHMKNNGNHLGFTFPSARTHTCFDSSQEQQLKNVLAPYLRRGLRYERTQYYRGNLDGEDFGINTFNEPLVQWCPVPITSGSTGMIFDKQEPWGLTTDKLIVLPSKLQNVIDRAILGLAPHGSSDGGNFNLYSIREIEVPVPKNVDYSQQPLIIDGRNLKFPPCDIWSCEDEAIVCSNRFAGLLNGLWNGLPDVKFQPIDCRNIDPGTARI